MATVIAGTSIGSGYRYDLLPGQDLLVLADVEIVAVDDVAIIAEQDYVEISVYGLVFGEVMGIDMIDIGHDASEILYVGQGGVVSSNMGVGVGARFTAASVEIINEGSISGNIAIQLRGSIFDMSDIINTAQITGRTYGILQDGSSTTLIQNHGTISGGVAAFHAGIFIANETIINRGEMIGDLNMGPGFDVIDNRGGSITGDVLLGSGDDTFDTRGGTVSGEVDGGAGNDLILSNFDVAEVLIGGDGTVDILDMRFGPGAIVALDGAFENAGSALGDVIGGFEYLFGSFAEADNLRGNGLGNFLFSFGGADVLDGAGGDDVLRGGTGQDTLTGGAGNDAFRYFTLTEMGDVITDFSSIGSGNNDTFQFSAAGIGGGLAVGTLSAAFFQTRTDNVAQDANDRFIFRTTDRTLWFDADGFGAGAARLVADLQASATVANHDILILA